ncbi:MAG TPA: protein phosphatase [Oceanospirillales bacterium]|nr:protein phosphatase [Oceanospirillaceae bacterium]HBS43146.1 protein phosphatase [Oceanospirillales bacterium]|tara:strand:+ start:2031 stop:2498 length:468 start_codon:yes stop_codon:yes gene_type:complete
MKHVFWLIDQEICGRPGPNHQPWRPEEFAKAGIGAILSVNSAESVYVDELSPHGINHMCIPLAVNAPPLPGELELCLERLPLAYRYVRDNVDTGKAVMVHCRHGKDRTGLFMAYYLMKRDELTVEQAIAQVKEVRPIAMSAEGWDQFVPEVLRAC